MSSSTHPTIGIIGSGFIINECHLPAYLKNGITSAAIASRTVENAEAVARQHGITTVHESIEAMLADASIEILDIAVPPQHQSAIILEACQRGTVKGILAQKPLTMDFAEAQELVAACERANITLAVNQNMRFDPAVAQTKRLLDAQTLGKPVFSTIEMRGIPHWQPWQESLQSATLRVMSIHHLDCMRFWHGTPSAIYCSTRPDPRTEFPHQDGICTSILEWDNGMRAVIIDDVWTGPAREGCPSDLKIECRLEGEQGIAIAEIGWVQDPYTTPSTLRYASKGDQGFHTAALEGSSFPDAFAGTMQDLITALENDTTPTLSGRDNLETLALVEAAVISSTDNRRVELSELIK